ncbi:hypothetical protein M422DRAFT_255512 [Sphaerobolus stellatus SS14]|uniref:Protein kinase domain-containing protein n=1 Tax=Sphaerobolus stellatus (strain SS14) TaxID=990650 RepID=A0A0C9UEZ8_SPHS4|nr:hypothetical protein M422DRAFT_255512 [Sphaerobolus stellatus SS14]
MLIVRKILTKKKQRIVPLDSDAWIFDAMNIAKTAASASKLVPVAGRFIEGGATLFYNALEQLKQMRKNKEDFKGLSEDIAILLRTFSDATAGRTSDSTYPEGFVRVCSEFQSSMENLAKEIGLLVANSQTKRLKTYLRANNIQESIAGYQTKIQKLRDNLIFYCALLSVRLFETDRLTSSSDEDFPELKEFRQVLQTDIHLKEEVNVEHSRHTGSLLFKEYHGTIPFNGKDYLTTTRSYEGESAQERLKVELKLLARIRHPNITQVAAVCFSASFPSIVYYDDLRPVDWSSEDVRIQDGPYTISYLTRLYRQMRAQREAIVHIIDKLPSFFIHPPRGNGWDGTLMGEEPVRMLFPLESHHYQYDNWTASPYTEPAEWQVRTHMTRGIRLKFDLSYCPDSTGSFHIWCTQRLTPLKRLELFHASMAQLCHIKGIFKDLFPGKCNSRNLKPLLLVTKLSWTVKVWKPVKRPNPPSVSELYLFIDDPVISQGRTEGPKVYWSKCPDGTARITTLELYALGIECAPVVWCEPEMILELNLDLVDMLRDFYQSCGLNPFSNEVSNLLELPLPQHVKLKPNQLKRRHSFSAYQQKPSRRDKILQENGVDFKSVCCNLGDGTTSLLPSVSDYLPEEYQLLQKFNRCLGTKVAKYWAFMAASELLPESLKLYDLRTTGDDFEYGETGIDPIYGEIPSRCWNFLKGNQRLHRPQARLRHLTEPPETPHPRHLQPRQLHCSNCRVLPRKAGTYDPARLFSITTLELVRATRFLADIAGTDPANPRRRRRQTALVHKIQYGDDEVVQVKGWRGVRDAEHGGEAGIVMPTFVKSPLFAAQGIEFFSSAVELGPTVSRRSTTSGATARQCCAP